MVNKKQGDEFLKANLGKAGVVGLANGMQYQVLAEGKGALPTAMNTVRCNYRGMHLDGREFFSTKAGEPAIFVVKEAKVPAFAEALPRMAAGAKWRLFVPPQLAYGEAGIGQTIEPNETLIFDLELVAIQ